MLPNAKCEIQSCLAFRIAYAPEDGEKASNIMGRTEVMSDLPRHGGHAGGLQL